MERERCVNVTQRCSATHGCLGLGNVKRHDGKASDVSRVDGSVCVCVFHFLFYLNHQGRMLYSPAHFGGPVLHFYV